MKAWLEKLGWLKIIKLHVLNASTSFNIQWVCHCTSQCSLYVVIWYISIVIVTTSNNLWISLFRFHLLHANHKLYHLDWYCVFFLSLPCLNDVYHWYNFVNSIQSSTCTNFLSCSFILFLLNGQSFSIHSVC